MTTEQKKFKIHLMKEPQLSVVSSEENKMVGVKEEKDVIVTASSCCEACIQAQKSWAGSLFTKWEELVEPKLNLSGV